MRFEGRIALVTGGSSGIGKAVARRLKEEGATVVTAQRGADQEFPSLEVDYSNSETVFETITKVVEHYGKLDILINNAGVMLEALVEDMSIEDWNKTLAINLTAPFLLIKAALPHLRATKGVIVNIGSIEATGSNPGHAAYCASKAGLHALTRSVAVDHGKEGIRCNAVAPGWIDTALNEAYIDSMPDPVDFRLNIGNIHPLNRTGLPEEVASLIVFLASDDSSFITGQIYVVDGGRTSKLSLP